MKNIFLNQLGFCMSLKRFELELQNIFFFISNISNQFSYFSPGFGYGQPNGLHPFMFNPGWLDAAYMSYGFPPFAKGKYMIE